MKVRTRIAPSPTGDPHIGTLYLAIFNYALAKKNNGQFILRIEDTDRERLIEGSTENILYSLKWARIEPDESILKKGKFGPYIQSERLEIYKKYIDRLIENKSAYYCFCTKERLEKLRADQTKNKVQPKYDKHCLLLTDKQIKEKLGNNTPFVIRLNVPQNEEIVFNDLVRGEIKINTNTIDDQVLLKSDGYPTYHAAVVIDDHLMQITHVMRGEEWISSTPKHILIYRSFGWDIPEFIHLSLLRNRDKSKISKRYNHTSLNWYIKEGFLPEALVNYLILLGWSHPEGKEIFDIQEFINKFSFDRINKGGPIFDLEKLKWMNGVYIRSKSISEIKKLSKPFIKYKIENKKLEEILKIIQERLKVFSEINDLISFFFEEPNIEKSILEENYSSSEVKEILSQSLKIIKKNGINEETEKLLREYAEKNKYNIGNFFMVIRISITGRKISPPLIETMKILSESVIEKRILNIINKI